MVINNEEEPDSSINSIDHLFKERINAYQSEHFYKIDNTLSKTIFDELDTIFKYKLNKHIDNVFDRFTKYELPKYKNKVLTCDQFNHISSLQEFKVLIDKIKKDVLLNFEKLHEYEKQTEEAIKEYNKAYKTIENINQLNDYISDNKKEILKECIDDITSKVLSKKTFNIKLEKYLKHFYTHHEYVNVLKSMNCLNNTSKCTLCLVNSIDTAIIPCGHTFCEYCIQMSNNTSNKCPICRTEYEKIQKLFIS